MLRRHRRLVIASVVVAVIVVVFAAGSNGSSTAGASAPPAAIASVQGVTQRPTGAPTPTPAATHAPAPTDASTPAPTRLLSFKGEGIKTSQAFTLAQDGDLNVAYSFDCRSFGSQGNFQLVLQDADTGDPVDFLANALAASGNDTTTPTEPAGRYKLEVNSECSWTVTVTGR